MRLFALTPTTMRMLVEDRNQPAEMRARYARVFCTLYGVSEYNEGRIDATELTKWLDLADDAGDDTVIACCLAMNPDG